MFETEEKRLNSMVQELDDVKIPDSIDDYIWSGMREARGKKRRGLALKWVSVAAAIFILGFATMIRVSPAVAAYVSQIPGFEKIVELIKHDKGLLSAIENDYIQELGVSDQKDGIQMKIDYAIADEEQVVLFYTLESNEAAQSFNLRSPKIMTSDGKEITSGISYSYGSVTEEKDQYSKIELYFTDGISVPSEFTLETKVETESGKVLTQQPLQLPIKLDMSKITGQKREVSLNEVIRIGQDDIIVEKMLVTPTRVGITLSFPESNPRKIFGFNGFRLSDETGEAWGTIADGITATHRSDARTTYYFQSNYFKKPKRLFLQFDSIRALPKEELDVVVDLEGGQLIKSPQDGKIKDVALVGPDLRFDVAKDESIKTLMDLFGHTYKDATGKTFTINQSFAGGPLDGISEIGVVIGSEPKRSPLTLTLQDYPNAVGEPVKLRLE